MTKRRKIKMENTNGNRPEVIIVTDNESQRLIYRSTVKGALDALGADAYIRFAIDGEMALQKIAQDPNPGKYILFVDHRLPRMNGAQLYSRLTQGLQGRTIFVTQAENSLREELSSLGLGKSNPRILGSPVDEGQLKEALSAYV